MASGKNRLKPRTVLVLAPHTDDAELGCGGTIAKLVELGDRVHVAALSIAEDSLPKGVSKDTLKKEFLRAMPLLGVPASNLIVHRFPVRRLSERRQDVLEVLVRLQKDLDPDMVYLPSAHDVHQDHQVVHHEGIRAFKRLTILAYELPWNHVVFAAQGFVALEERHLEKKWRAMQEYKTQMGLKRPYFSRDLIAGLARVRGSQIGTEYAEAFEVVRVRIA